VQGPEYPFKDVSWRTRRLGHLPLKNAIKWACLKTAYSIPSHRFSPSYPSRSNQWSFQEPKLEVPTIYNAYFSDLCKGISPQNMARNMVQYLRFRILKLPSRSRYGTKKWWYQLPNPISTPVSRIQTLKVKSLWSKIMWHVAMFLAHINTLSHDSMGNSMIRQENLDDEIGIITYYHTHNCLVIDLPLWKIWKSVGVTIPNIYGKIKFMFQTTNQIL
jgi:hypothetical protein